MPATLYDGQKGATGEMARTADELHKKRFYHHEVRRFARVDVPVFVLSLGGERQKTMIQELKDEQVTDFIVVGQPSVDLLTDYPVKKSEVGCTRAHIAFAQSLLKKPEVDCAVVVEDDASFALTSHWPFSLREICNRMFENHDQWTTLMLYSSDRKLPNENHVLSVTPYREGIWGTVAYLATQRWARLIVNITANNTRLFKKEIGSKYGTADSSVYAFKGAKGYILRPNFVFPNNLVAKSTIGNQKRDKRHIGVANELLKVSLSAFENITGLGLT
jgi:GR25 family glycosyltransferase involved in LPS biosynthesis